MAKQIAAKETWGPNPELGRKRFFEYIDAKHNNEQIKLTGKATEKKVSAHAEKIYNVAMGKIPVNNTTIAQWMADIRTLSIAAKSPKIMLTQLTDLPNSVRYALTNGVGMTNAVRIPFRALKNSFALMDKVEAARSGYTCESLLGFHNRIEGVMDDSVHAHKFISTLSDFVYRSTGVTRWTESFQMAYAVEMNHFLTKQTDKSWEYLNPRTRRWMGRYGINSLDWDIMRDSILIEDGTFGKIESIDPTLFKDVELKRKFLGMFATESRIAIPEPGWREAAIFRGENAGSLQGETMRTFGMFKSFAATQWNTMVRPVFSKFSSGSDRLELATYVLVVAPVFGYGVIAAKALTRGEIPPDPFDGGIEKFGKVYIASLLQSGGLGYAGDILLKPSKGNVSNIATTIVGPLGSDVDGIIRSGHNIFSSATENNGKKWDKTQVELVDKVVNYGLPVLNSWFIGPLGDKYIKNPIKESLDPRYKSRMRAAQRKREKEDVTGGIWFDTL